MEEKKNIGRLIAFHTQHKLLILSHSPKHHPMMGKLVAKAKEIPWIDLQEEYQRLLPEVLYNAWTGLQPPHSP